MTDYKSPFMSTVRANSPRFLPKLNTRKKSIEKSDSSTKNMNQNQFNFPSNGGRYHPRRPRRLSKLNIDNVKENLENDDSTTASTTPPKFGFGVAFQISKFIGHFKRRNSPEKLQSLQEYADMEHSGASLNDIQGQTTQTAFFLL